jgi:hypothetical protein
MLERHFKSLLGLEELGTEIRERMLSSELDLSYFERSTVEDHVSTIIGQLYGNHKLRKLFNLKGKVKFENHSQTLSPDPQIEAQIQSISLSGDTRRRSPRLRTQTNSQVSSSSAEPPAAATSTKDSWPRPRADQFCVYNITGDSESRVAAFIAEYKAPHKLTLGYIYEGLDDMDLNDVVYFRDGESTKDRFRRLVAAVITQAFSYMVSLGLEYGYVCTGEAFIFLRVPEDPSTVYYFLSVPKGDVGETTGWQPDLSGSNQLHLTAVGQVLAFTLQALRTQPRSSAWRTAARAKLNTWEVVYEDILNEVLRAVPTHETPSSEYRPPRLNRPLRRSPIRLRNRPPRNTPPDCHPPRDESSPSEDGSNPDTPSRPRRSRSQNPPKTSQAGRSTSSRNPAGKDGNGQFCTQNCLLGLANGGPLDSACPNVEEHGRDSHQIDRSSFLVLMRHQLARDLDADFEPMGLPFTSGVPFKVRLAIYGYTLFAKGTSVELIHRLKCEAAVYNRLKSIQGIHVPVHLGNIDLDQSYYYQGASVVHLMFLSFGGTPILRHMNDENKTALIQQTKSAIHAIHQLKVLHQDAMPRNILWNSVTGQPMVIDFERAKISALLVALGVTSPNRKRKRDASDDMSQQRTNSPDPFQSEMNRVMFELRGVR